MAVDVIARSIASGRVPITAYDMAVAGGYTGTKEQFEADMGNSGTNATNAANSAAAAAASAAEASAIADDIAQYKTDTMTAPANITAGEYILAAGTLYVATANIASGATLTPNGNVTQVTVGEELTKVIASDAQKADADGTSPNLTAGNALQLVSTVGIEDQVPYNFRTSGGAADIGDRETDMIVGGTVAWNQLVQNGNFDGLTNWTQLPSGTFTAEDNTLEMVLGENQSGFLYQFIPGIKDHYYLISVDLKDSGLGVYVYWDAGYGSISVSTIQTFTRVTRIYKYAGNGNNISIRRPPNTTAAETIYAKNMGVFDLTQMFGPTIADYVYSLEQNNAGDGVAWFRKLFPNDYYAYDAGTLRSVQTSAHRMIGFNAFDKNASDVTIGKYLNASGELASNSVSNVTGYIPVIGGQTYYFADAVSSAVARYMFWYDSGKNIIGGSEIPFTGDSSAHHKKTAPENAAYVRVSVAVTKWDSFVVNLSWDGEKDGTYEPYVEYTYPLDDSLELRGIPKLDANNKLYYDGDTYESDGTVTRRYGVVDLGSINWIYYNGCFNAELPSTPMQNSARTKPNAIVGSGYQYFSSAYGNTTNDKAFCFNGGKIWIYDSTYASYTKEQFKTAMSGVMLVYELDTPTTESADPYTNPQIVDDLGTEEYVDAGVEAGTRDVAIPVGHETFYQANLRAKLEMAPDSPSSGDGDYIVRQANGENTYVPLVIPNELPAQPSEDGTYHLQGVVTGGVLTLSWVADT